MWTDEQGESLVRIECSLPKVYFGSNGRVLENQNQLDAALLKLRDTLNEFAVVPDFCKWQVCRVDIAWNFEGPARPLIMAHAALKVPGIRRGATLFAGAHGVSFRGAKSRYMVTLYDKARKMGQPGSVLRVEISLRGEYLARRFPVDTWRDFNSHWKTFRGTMATIPPIKALEKVSNIREAIGGESPEVRARIISRLAHKPRRTVDRWRSEIEAAAAALHEDFSWAERLPIGSPPPAVNIEPKRRTK